MSVRSKKKRLYRSREDKIIAGICGGFGDYFDVDPIIFRTLFIVLTFVSGIGLLLYIIFWIVVPRESVGSPSNNENILHTHEISHNNPKNVYSNTAIFSPKFFRKRRTGRVMVALSVILVGVIALLSNLFSFNLLRFEILWPLFLIFIGFYFIFKKE